MISRFSYLKRQSQGLYQVVKKNFAQENKQELLEAFLNKYKKNVNKDTFQEILKVCNAEERVQLFKTNWFTKAFFLVSRYQILAYCIGGGLYSFYIMPEKWQKIKAMEEKERVTKKEQKEIIKNKQKIIGGGIVLLISGILGLSLTLAMGKRLIKTIYWLPKENKFEINYFSFFGFSKPIKVSPSDIIPIQKPKRFDTTIVWELKNKPEGYQYFSTKGTGAWANKELFEYIVTNTQ
mgnify:CR=1 FL=1